MRLSMIHHQVHVGSQLEPTQLAPRASYEDAVSEWKGNITATKQA
jgi:hypothetical protein